MQKILIIEDEDHIREVYKEELESAGFVVRACATGKQGLEVFFQEDFQLVLLDLVLPDINGLDILEKIKKDSIKKTVPVLILSNLDQDIIVRQGLQLGAETYLQKVANTPDVIVNKIKEILEKVSAKKNFK